MSVIRITRLYIYLKLGDSDTMQLRVLGRDEYEKYYVQVTCLIQLDNFLY